MKDPARSSAAPVKPKASTAQRRIAVIFYIFAIATAAVLARIAYLATFHQAERDALNKAATIARTLTIPGTRGKIFASDGTLLASSERRINVTWRVPVNYNVAENHWRELADIPWMQPPSFDQLQFLPGTDFVVAHDLPFDDPSLWETLLAMPELQPLVYFKRKVNTEHPEGKWVGDTLVDPISGLELGVSGLEKLHDARLRAGTSKCRFLRSQFSFTTDGPPPDGADFSIQAPMPDIQ